MWWNFLDDRNLDFGLDQHCTLLCATQNLHSNAQEVCRDMFPPAVVNIVGERLHCFYFLLSPDFDSFLEIEVGVACFCNLFLVN